MGNEIAANDFSLDTIITNAIKIPGVKVNRSKFLADIFADDTSVLDAVISDGPVEAGISQEHLRKLANKLIMKRTSESSAISFAAGLPGGIAMAATIPADVAQFFGMALRLAQELSYLYGAQDLWQDGEIDDEQVKNKLVLYCGVMFGVSGASAGLRVLTAQLSKTALKKIPQKALMKTVWYPILKKIGVAVGVKVTKQSFAKVVSKAIPVAGGVISGGLNFASMLPMAQRLQKALDEASFGYAEEAMEADIIEIETLSDTEDEPVDNKFKQTFRTFGDKVSGTFSKKQKTDDRGVDVYSEIEKLFHLKEIGAITEEEYNDKKQDLLSKL